MPRVYKKWNYEKVARLKSIVSSSETKEEVINAASVYIGDTVSESYINRHLVSYGYNTIDDILNLKRITSKSVSPEAEKLISFITKNKRSSFTMNDVCNTVLDCSPKKAAKVIDEAIKAGYNINVHDDTVGYKKPTENESIISISRDSNSTSHKIGVISDIHVGSKYFKKSWLKDHLQYCYDNGVTDILCPGDLLEGCYKHARFELSHVGWNDQASEAIDSLTKFDGIKYHFIDGNHDFTFSDSIGIESGKQFEVLSRSLGRDDIKFYGSRGCSLLLGTTVIEMWHPKKNLSYALSYQLQNHIRDMANKPDILLAGHWHQFIYFEKGDVHAFACGTFQHGDSPFGKSLGGSVAIGGLTLEWTKDENKINDMKVMFRKVK